MLVVTSMLVGSASALTGCSESKDAPVTLNVYSQVANYSGMQSGWFADILLKKFNVKLNIIPDAPETFQTKMESKDMGDIVVWGDEEQYAKVVKAKLLYDWNDDDLLQNYGAYIKDNMSDALRKNSKLTSKITNGTCDIVYGYGYNVANSSMDHESFFYTWDTRWDLYKKLGYPKINDLEDYARMLKKMQKLEPKGEDGEKKYAFSLWPDWDKDMVMYVKATATAYYGYDEMGVGLYDAETGDYHDALEENGPYLEILKFYNHLYREGLIDPDSMTQNYARMIEKVQNGRTLSSIFNYTGQLAYNSDEHKAQGKMMYCMRPEDATVLVYGMNTQGGNMIWSIGAQTAYPELCMKIINYLSTPEGRLTIEYGPKGSCWYYDKDGYTHLTKLGRSCHTNPKQKMGDVAKGTFQDGQLKINNTTWALDAENPDSNGETFNCDNWQSMQEKPDSSIMKDWQDTTGCIGINDYMEAGKYQVVPRGNYTANTKSDELSTTWNLVTKTIREGSWNAIYAASDQEYEKIVCQMRTKAKEYGYDTCVDWSVNEAALRKQADDIQKQVSESNDSYHTN